MKTRKPFNILMILLVLTVVTGCGGGGGGGSSSGSTATTTGSNGNPSNTTTTIPQSAASVTISPATLTMAAGATQQFSAAVTGVTNTAITWTASAGAITATGLFTAPPSANASTATITATSVGDGSKAASSTVAILGWTAWGSNGSGNGQFGYPNNPSGGPEGVAVDSAGNVYVADWLNSRVEKFDANGNYLLQWTYPGITVQYEGANYTWPFMPGDIAVDNANNIYVGDEDGCRVVKFDSSGNYLLQFGGSGCHTDQIALDTSGGIAVDASGNIYVVDVLNYQVQKFDSKGNFITKWGSLGTGNGQFGAAGGQSGMGGPIGIAIDGAGDIYVVDQENARVQKFDSNGNYLSQFGTYGTGNGQFAQPLYIAIDSAGNIYVTDGVARVEKFDKNGAYLTQWGSVGTGIGQFIGSEGIAVDSVGDIYVADSFNYRVEKFSPVIATGANTGSTAVSW